MNAPGRDRSRARPPAFARGGVFRLSRTLHAYLSAFAFLALILFSATGILLNHPEWFEAYRPTERPLVLQVSPAELAAARAAPDPGRALARIVKSKAPVAGAFSSADVEAGSALLRFEGPKGTTDLTVDLATGKAEGRVARAGVLALVQDLHRGKNSGAAWRFVIDASAWLVLALSLLGYVLFFSLRFRLKTSLALTAASLALLAGVAWLTVP